MGVCLLIRCPGIPVPLGDKLKATPIFMEVLKRSVRGPKTKEEYIEIMRSFVAYANQARIKVTRTTFGSWCARVHGSNFESAMRKRFGDKGRENGWNVICQIVGVPLNKAEYTEEELLQWLDKIYTHFGRKHQPGESAIRRFRDQLPELEKAQCPYVSTFEKRFKGLGKAWDAYFKAYNVTATYYHGTIRKNGKPEGFYFPYLREYYLEKTPVNEQGVVFLFSRLCQELGFSDVSIQEAFPDAQAIYSHPKQKEIRGKGRRVKIEFKYSIQDFFKSLTLDFSLEKETRWQEVHYVICWEYGRTSTLMDKYKSLENKYPLQAQKLKQYLLGIEFIVLKDYLEQKHNYQ